MGLRRHADEWERTAERIEASDGPDAITVPVEKATLTHADSVLSLIVARYGRAIPDDVRRDADELIGELRKITR